MQISLISIDGSPCKACGSQRDLFKFAIGIKNNLSSTVITLQDSRAIGPGNINRVITAAFTLVVQNLIAFISIDHDILALESLKPTVLHDIIVLV